MQIVKMEKEHCEILAELEKLCFSRPWSRKALEDEVDNPRAYFVTAVDGDKILGYGGMHCSHMECYIDNIAVEPNARRHGVADELLDVFCRFGEANLAFLTLEVRASNAPAIALYRKHGFEEAGRRKNYYTKPAEDAIIMTRYFKRIGTEHG